MSGQDSIYLGPKTNMVVSLWVEIAPHDPLVLEIGGMGAALGAHQVSTAVANPPALIK